MKALDDLKETLSQKALRFRTGVLVEERVDRDSLDPLALRLQASVIDYHQLVSSRLLNESRVLPLDAQDILKDLRDVANSEGPSPVGLILNVDLALAKLSQADVAVFWDGFSRLEPFAQTAVVVAIPASAASVQPTGQTLNSWKAWGRIAFDVRNASLADEERV